MPQRLIQRLQQHRPVGATASGWLAFQLGVLLLASSLLLAVVPLFWALLEGSRRLRRPWWGDRREDFNQDTPTKPTDWGTDHVSSQK